MKKKTRILHLLQSSHFSGAENVACQIIMNLNDEYEMVYASPSGTIEKKLNEFNIRYYPMKKLNLYNVNKVIGDFKPDIIHAHDFTASVTAAISGFKGKIISQIHNNPPFIKKWGIKSIVFYLTLKKYSKIIGVSNSITDEAVFGKNMEEIFVKIYNYVDKSRVINLAQEKDIDNNKTYDIAFIGRLVNQKDPFLFIDIVNEIKKTYTNIRAVMIGDGPLFEKCNRVICQYNLQDNIELIGFVNNPYSTLEGTKVVVMPSKWEGFGLTSIEALILKKPVLNSGVGGLKEIFENDDWFICSCKRDYEEKIKKIFESEFKYDYESIYAKYVNKNTWIQEFKNIYK